MGLDHLLGTWTTTMRHVQVSEPVIGHQRYERVLEQAFVLLHWTIDHPDFPDALALLSPTALHTFDVRGVARVFDFAIDGSGWSTIRRDDDFWQRCAVTFDGQDAMHGAGQNSHDRGATWQHDFDISYVRTS